MPGDRPRPRVRFPEEVVVERFVPTARHMLARALEQRGLSQTAIAVKMGVSQSAVSKHLVGRFAVEPRFAEDARLKDAVARVADGLVAGTMGPMEALAAFESVVRAFEDRGPICAVHEEVMPELQGLGCDVCVRVGGSAPVESERVLASVREAARLLAATPAFVALVPHVGANVAMALPGAKDPFDVAALPGGLVESRGRVRAPSAPEFGVSKTLAEVLIAATEASAGAVRAALNLRPDPRFLDAARQAGLVVAEMPGAHERDAEGLRRHLAGARPFPDVLFHRGDFGIEPIAYAFGADAAAVARRVAGLL